MKVILKCVNIKLWDILGCFHYILNAPRKSADLRNKFMINFTTVWDRAGIKHVTPGSAVRRESVFKNVTDCAFL